MASVDTRYREYIADVAKQDVDLVLKKDKEYGASWKKRGGQGAYFTMVRKVDRLEEQCSKHAYDIFKACEDKTTSESILDTMRDLRAYLLLIESEVRARMNATQKEHSVDEIEINAQNRNFLEQQRQRDRKLGEEIAKTYDQETRTLVRCGRCHDFHLHPDDCPQDPGPAHP